MRVRVTFKVKNRGAAIPFHHQHLIANLLDQKIRKVNSNGLGDFSLFSFSGVKGLTRVSRQGLHYHSKRVSIVLGSINEEYVRLVLSEIFKSDSLKFGDLEVIPEQVDQELLPEFESEVKLVCISPIVPTSPNDDDSKQFIDPFSNEFSDYLFDVVATKFESVGGQPDTIPDFNKFQIVPDRNYIDKINSNGKKYSRIYRVQLNNKEREVRGYTFPFTLYAPPEIQKFIFLCGLGHFGNRGFGMVDLANHDPLERTVAFDLDSASMA